MKKISDRLRDFKFMVVMLLPVAMLCGCTRNNGDIGHWFGTWRVESITLDGHPDPDYPKPAMIWKFQSHIVMIMVPDEVEHSAPGTIGTWNEKDGVLTLDFSDEVIGPWTEVTHFEMVSHLDVLKLTSGNIRLRYETSSGTYIYELKKWG
ncbi:MAG: lipocalin-like domain-containing protein [Clostridiales bacterium]|nr:lipocalin-like domain-containing protein [Clostridiales bacterium]